MGSSASWESSSRPSRCWSATPGPTPQLPVPSPPSRGRRAGMEEVVPGIHHWTAMHPNIHERVSSYYVEPAGIVIDPLEPEEGMGFFDELDLAPQQVVLTSGLHWRHADRFRDRYGATVRVVSAGVPRWEGSDRSAETFEFGDEV